MTTDFKRAHEEAYELVDQIADRDLVLLAHELQWFDMHGTIPPGGMLDQIAKVLRPFVGASSSQAPALMMARRAAAAWIINAFIELHA